MAVLEINIDAGDANLRERYTFRVPVLSIGNTELDWPFTDREVRRALADAALG